MLESGCSHIKQERGYHVRLYCIVLACFVLITYIGGQERLYCTHEALNVALEEPSAFCQVAGRQCMLLQYAQTPSYIALINIL